MALRLTQPVRGVTISNISWR